MRRSKEKEIEENYEKYKNIYIEFPDDINGKILQEKRGLKELAAHKSFAETRDDNDILIKRKKINNYVEDSNEEKNCFNGLTDNKNIIDELYSDDSLVLFNLLRSLKFKTIDCKTYNSMILRCKDMLIREIDRNINPTGDVFHPSDDINIKNSIRSNVNIYAKILNYLLSTYSFRSNAISKEDLFSLFKLLKSEDSIERKNIGNVLIQLFLRYQIYKETIINIVENEISLFFEGYRTHIGIEEIIEISYSILDEQDSHIFYHQFILKFMKCKTFEFYRRLESIIYIYCLKNAEISFITLKYISYVFKEAEHMNKVSLVRLFVKIYVEWHKSILFENIEVDLSRMINSSLQSCHYILIEEVLEIFENEILYECIKQHIESFLPQIFNNLYKLSKKYWRSKGRIRVYKNISIILSMDHKVFETCLINYNRKRSLDIRNKESIINVLGTCIEHSKLERENEKNFNERRKSNSDFNKKTEE